MKKFKYALWALFIAFLGWVVWDNQGVFLAKHDIDINLWFVQYELVEIYSIVIIAAFFFLGMLIAFAASLFERYRAHVQIRSLKQTLAGYTSTIDQLKQEVEGLKLQTQTEEVQPEVATQPSEPEEVENATT